jgi:hypothetical protein
VFDDAQYVARLRPRGGSKTNSLEQCCRMLLFRAAISDLISIAVGIGTSNCDLPASTSQAADTFGVY